MNATKANVNDRSEAYHTGYEAHEQGEPKGNATAHYAAGTWEHGEWLTGWGDAEGALQEFTATPVEINHERFGERTRFTSIAEAESELRSIGHGFASVTLTRRVESVTDERGEVVGRLLFDE